MHSVPVPINVRCCTNSDVIVRRSEVTRRATNRLMHRNKQLRGCAPSEGGFTLTNKDKEAAN
jgi:hypothetical protein